MVAILYCSVCENRSTGQLDVVFHFTLPGEIDKSTRNPPPTPANHDIVQHAHGLAFVYVILYSSFIHTYDVSATYVWPNPKLLRCYCHSESREFISS